MTIRTHSVRGILVRALAALFFLAISSGAFAQIGPGVIIRACTNSTGRDILSPNYSTVTKSFGSTTYHYASATNAGWTLNGNDTSAAVNNIPYKAIAPYCGEPCCDLRRGPDHRFSDIVYDQQRNGVYMHYDATNQAVLFRFRMGDIIPGAKGFSLLIDTDLKWGGSGTNADPNYKAQTTGINGNRGYELELVCESGFRIALYDIDGLFQPSDNIRQNHLLWSSDTQNPIKNWTDYSQIVMAATTENGDPDYFIDFYIPASALLNTNTYFNVNGTPSIAKPIRIIPTTVMAPKPSTAGPISDIYGCDDSTTIINQPPICISCNTPTGLCTPAPVLNNVNLTAPGGTSATVSGTWTADSRSSRTATIYIYKNGDTTNAIATTTVTNTNYPASNNWSFSVGNLAAGNTLTAKAQGVNASYPYESRWCNSSNTVTVTSCTQGSPTAPAITCIQKNGIEGSGFSSGKTITVYKRLTTGDVALTSPVAQTPTTPLGNSGLTWDNGAGVWYYGGGCSSGNSQLDPGTYYAYITDANGCASAVAFGCQSQNQGSKNYNATMTPTLTTPSSGTSITTSTTSIGGSWSGTGGTPAQIRVFKDNYLLGNATIDGSGWSYSLAGVTLTTSNSIRVSAQAAQSGNNYYCAGDLMLSVTAPACSNIAPAINVDSATVKLIPGTVITGTATPNSTVKLYNNLSAVNPVATTTATSSGYWTSGVTATSAGGVTTYYATVTTSGCATAATSGNYTVSTSNTDSRYCGGGVSFSVDAASGGSYTQVYDASGNAVQTTINGQTVNQPFYSDANWIKGTFPSGITAPASTRVTVYVNDAAVASYTFPGSGNGWGPVNVSGMLFQGAELTIAVSESGNTGEYLCATQKIICACALANTPTAPIIGLSSKTSVNSGQKARLVITNPTDNYFYRVYNASGTAISDGIWYNSALGSPTVGRVEATDSIIINSYTVAATTLADVKALYVGGTESCTSTTQKTITFLPIALLEFRGSRQGKDNVLNWRTADEVNAAFFQLERSSDGNLFTTIARMQTTGSNSSYAFTDDQPLTGDNFYRLKMVDIDGRFKYSNVIRLRGDGTASVALETARPNPFQNKISFSVFLPEAGAVQAQLVDMTGRTVLRRTLNGARGTNDFTLSDLGTLSNGLYVLKLQVGEKTYQEKLVRSGR